MTRFIMVYFIFCAAGAQADTLKLELRQFAGAISEQCESVREQDGLAEAGNDPLIAFTLKDAVHSLCVCIPGRNQALLASLSERELAGNVTESELMSLLNERVFEFCAARQFRNMYGQQCAERFKAPGLDVRKYCTCMSYTASIYPDSKAAQIANAAADYLPRAAAAEKEGLPAPERPPVLEEYFLADKSCKGR